MRRWLGVTLAAVMPLTGCRSSRVEVAADAMGQQLKVERLAQLMTSIKGVPLTTEAAAFVANTWVDYTLFAQSVAAGRDLADSATTLESLWPDVAEARGIRWHDTLIARRVPIRPDVADSIYAADQVRILQHILVRMEPNAEPPVREAARRRADRVYARVQRGGDFAKLAQELSEDPGSRQDGGYLPASPRGKWVTAFDSAGWSLAPGGMTPLVETPFGFHIIRRPPAPEVRDRLLPFAREEVGQKIDSMYLDSLAVAKALQVASGAPALIRKALADQPRWIKSNATLATYTGGGVTVRQFLRWGAALGPAWAHDLPARPDSSLSQFVRLIAQNQLLLAQADSAGVQLSPDEWASMRQRFRGQVDTLRMLIDIAGGDVTDPATAAADRARVAAIKMESFWDRLAAGRSRPRPMPGQLVTVLRDTGEYHLHRPGLERAARLALAIKARADSASLAPPASAPAPEPGAAPLTPPPSSGGQ